MSTEYVFTPVYARVFSRYIHYHYDKIIDSFEQAPQTIMIDRLLFRFKDIDCRIVYDYADYGFPTQVISTHLKFIIVASSEYLLGTIVLWKRDENISLEQIESNIQSYIGTTVKICICGEQVTSPKMDRCEECFVFGIEREEPCCICLENDYRWIKLLCNCKNGRIIHRHCYFQLSVNPDSSIRKRRCPCCRKYVSHWIPSDLLEDPDFYQTK